MSADDDTELRDLVAQTLETNGILNKMRAELRANVFLALEEQDALQNKKLNNLKLVNYLETAEGKKTISLVREFLQFFHLDFTVAVLDPESGHSGKFSSRNDLLEEFNLSNVDSSKPVLMEVLRSKKRDETFNISPPSPKLSSSKIPQRISEIKAPKQDMMLSKSEKNKVPKEQKPETQRVLLNEQDDDLGDADDLLRELGVSISPPPQNTKRITKPSWLDSPPELKKDTEPPVNAGSLGSLKNAPPLPGLNGGSKQSGPNMLDDSGSWGDIVKIDNKITQMGFPTPKNEDYEYDDDFQGTSSRKSEGLSITEEIEEDLSIGSFADSKDDLMTEDQTVSQISNAGLDYVEEPDSNR